MRSQNISIVLRSILALLLTIGFYALGLGIAFGLLWLVYAQVVIANRINLRLTLFAVIGAGGILLSLIPRRAKFVAPGPQLDPAQEPRLFAAVQEIADKTEQRMPDEIYVVPEVNAFVSEYGGFLGMGTRRIMGLGIPLMQTMTVPQMQAVIAHEFGHFYGGDTRVGMLVYQIRSTIIRTVQTLGGGLLQKPFVWYAKLFLRITNAVSRQREFVADEVAARTMGNDTMIDGLHALPGASVAFDTFWQNEYVPVLNNGFRPSLVSGFNQYVAAPRTQELMDAVFEHSKNQKTSSDPYDTHPTMAERVAAIQALPTVDSPSDSLPAISLIENLGACEEMMLDHLLRVPIAQLKQIEWSELAQASYLPSYTENVQTIMPAFNDMTAGQIGTLVEDPQKLFDTIRAQNSSDATDDQLQESVVPAVGQALIVALCNAGWQIESKPGYSVRVHKDDQMFEPYQVISELVEKKKSSSEWSEEAAALGIADVPMQIEATRDEQDE